MTRKSAAAREPAYLKKISSARADALYIKILERLTKAKLYRDPSYSTARLAADLQTNTRYIAAAVAVSTGGNYCALVNSLRLRDACKMLRSPKYASLSAEEIGLLSGFSSRQAFYKAFHRVHDCTPRAFRMKGREEDGGE